MKVALDAYHAIYPSGGIARYTRALISALAQLNPNDRFILFYNLFRENKKAWAPAGKNCEIKKIVFPKRMLRVVWDSLDCFPIERLCGPIDIFHGLHFTLPPARKAKRVLTVHDLTYLKFPAYFTDRKLNERGYKQELPRALGRADAIIAVSDKTRDDLMELLGFPEERIRVIHEGVEPHFFNPARDEIKAAKIRKLYGLTQPYLVFLVGTPEPRKNLLRTVHAARLGAPEYPLALVGPRKPLQTELGADAKEVLFTGVVPENHLATILSGAVISLYPSLYEGFGLPVLESMAAGAPVVSSNRGSIPEVAGKAALLADPENTESLARAISTLIQDGPLQDRLREEGRKRASQFTWQKAAQQTLSLYRELL